MQNEVKRIVQHQLQAMLPTNCVWTLLFGLLMSSLCAVANDSLQVLSMDSILLQHWCKVRKYILQQMHGLCCLKIGSRKSSHGQQKTKIAPAGYAAMADASATATAQPIFCTDLASYASAQVSIVSQIPSCPSDL